MQQYRLKGDSLAERWTYYFIEDNKLNVKVKHYAKVLEKDLLNRIRLYDLVEQMRKRKKESPYAFPMHSLTLYKKEGIFRKEKVCTVFFPSDSLTVKILPYNKNSLLLAELKAFYKVKNIPYKENEAYAILL